MRDLGGADDPAGAIPDGGDGQRDIDPGAILAHALGLIMLDALPTHEPLKQVGERIGHVGRDQERERLPQDFGRRVAVHSLCPPVPAGDKAI